MHRRDFLSASLAAGAAPALATTMTATTPATTSAITPAGGADGAPFRLNYAPHFGMFRHHAGDDLVAQLEFMHAEGFRAMEDNGMRGRSKEDQERVARAMERLGMTMGVFVAHADFGRVTFASRDAAMRDELLAAVRDSVETAKRTNARWCTVVLGLADTRSDWDYQTARAVDNLKRCTEICAPAGLVMVLEPLNKRDHPGLFLTKMAQAYQICRAVDSPSCKILDDLYHQQITEGNLIPNIDDAWDEIAYFQVGDNPGRREPTTGEINYRNVFAHIRGKGFAGVVGMEHGNSQGGREGERRVIEAYRAVDAG